MAFSPGYNVEAAILNVSTPAEFQTALDTAKNNGQDDTINVAAGTYNITTTLIYNYIPSETYSLTIQGAGAGSTILDGGNSVPILSISSVGQVFVKDITFQNGNSASGMGGGLYIYSQNGTVENCDFSGNFASGGGGGVSGSSSGTITLNKNTFTNNTSTGGLGSGLYVTSGTITLTENTFTNNSGSSQGGGAYLRYL